MNYTKVEFYLNGKLVEQCFIPDTVTHFNGIFNYKKEDCDLKDVKFIDKIKAV